MIQEHFAAVRVLVGGVLPAAVQVVDSALVTATGELVRGQYVVLFGGGPDTLDDDRITSPQQGGSDAVYGYTARCVSVTADGARGVAGVVQTVVGLVPVVAGRRCGPLGFDGSEAVKVDTNIRPYLYYVDIYLTLKSDRA